MVCGYERRGHRLIRTRGIVVAARATAAWSHCTHHSLGESVRQACGCHDLGRVRLCLPCAAARPGRSCRCARFGLKHRQTLRSSRRVRTRAPIFSRVSRQVGRISLQVRARAGPNCRHARRRHLPNRIRRRRNDAPPAAAAAGCRHRRAGHAIAAPPANRARSGRRSAPPRRHGLGGRNPPPSRARRPARGSLRCDGVSYGRAPGCGVPVLAGPRHGAAHGDLCRVAAPRDGCRGRIARWLIATSAAGGDLHRRPALAALVSQRTDPTPFGWAGWQARFEFLLLDAATLTTEDGSKNPVAALLRLLASRQAESLPTMAKTLFEQLRTAAADGPGEQERQAFAMRRALMRMLIVRFAGAEAGDRH